MSASFIPRVGMVEQVGLNRLVQEPAGTESLDETIVAGAPDGII